MNAKFWSDYGLAIFAVGSVILIVLITGIAIYRTSRRGERRFSQTTAPEAPTVTPEFAARRDRYNRMVDALRYNQHTPFEYQGGNRYPDGTGETWFGWRGDLQHATVCLVVFTAGEGPEVRWNPAMASAEQGKLVANLRGQLGDLFVAPQLQ